MINDGAKNGAFCHFIIIWSIASLTMYRFSLQTDEKEITAVCYHDKQKTLISCNGYLKEAVLSVATVVSISFHFQP